MDNQKLAQGKDSKNETTRAALINDKELNLIDSETLAMKGRNRPELKNIWGKYIYEKSLTLLGGERGSGKSFLALEICLAVSYEYESFLSEQINLPGNTIYLDFELGDYIMSKRLETLYSAMDKQKDKFDCYLEFPRESLTEYLESLVKKIIELKPVLIVIDNLKTAWKDIDLVKQGNHAIKVLEMLNNIKKKHGVTFLVVCHTKKHTRIQLTESDLISGSGSIPDVSDADFFLRKCKDVRQRILKRDKSRFCEETGLAKIIAMGDTTRWFQVLYEDVDESEFLPIDRRVKGTINPKVEIAYDMSKSGKSLREIGAALDVSHVSESIRFSSLSLISAALVVSFLLSLPWASF